MGGGLKLVIVIYDLVVGGPVFYFRRKFLNKIPEAKCQEFVTKKRWGQVPGTPAREGGPLKFTQPSVNS